MCFERRINVLYHEIPTIFDISFNILFVPGLNGISRETPGCQNREFPVLPGFSYRDLMRFPGRSRFLTPGLTGSFTREVPGWNSRFWLKFAGTGSPKNACPGTGTGRNRESRSGTIVCKERSDANFLSYLDWHRVIIRLEYIFDPKWGWDHVPRDLSSKYLRTLRPSTYWGQVHPNWGQVHIEAGTKTQNQTKHL